MKLHRVILATIAIFSLTAVGCMSANRGMYGLKAGDAPAIRPYQEAHKVQAGRVKTLAPPSYPPRPELALGHAIPVPPADADPTNRIATTPAQPRLASSVAGPLNPAQPAYRTHQAASQPQPRDSVRGSAVSFEGHGTAPTTPAQAPTYTERTQTKRAGFHHFGELENDLAQGSASPMDSQDNLRRVTFTTEGADFDVELDPAGRLLAFASTRHRPTSDIYLQSINGTAVTQLTTDPSNDVMPCISPNGKEIAFASDRSGSWDIYLMDINGGQAVKLTDDGAQNIHPSFSPDGTQLVYSSFGSRSGVWELVLVDIAQPTHRRIIGHGLFPVWSPTDNTIAYQRARERGSRWFSVWTVQVKDGEANSPTEVAASHNAAVITPEWSPDGKSIVFCTVLDPTTDSDAGPRADIWVCNADGSGRVRLTHGNYANLQPTWAGNGTIYFISDRGVNGIENVWAVQPDQAVFLARDRSVENEGPAEASVPTPTP